MGVKRRRGLGARGKGEYALEGGREPLAEVEEAELAVDDAAADLLVDTEADLLAETNAELDALELELACLLELELRGLLDVPACFDVELAALAVPALLDVVVWWLELELEKTLLLSGAATARLSDACAPCA